MNTHYFQDSSRSLDLDISEVKNQTISSIFSGGKVKHITVNDDEFNDTYNIRLENSNRGINGMCFLGFQPSYQADFMSGGSLKLKDVINNIAGGEII